MKWGYVTKHGSEGVLHAGSQAAQRRAARGASGCSLGWQSSREQRVQGLTGQERAAPRSGCLSTAPWLGRTLWVPRGPDSCASCCSARDNYWSTVRRNTSFMMEVGVGGGRGVLQCYRSILPALRLHVLWGPCAHSSPQPGGAVPAAARGKHGVLRFLGQTWSQLRDCGVAASGCRLCVKHSPAPHGKC